jgi:hypothetical protein
MLFLDVVSGSAANLPRGVQAQKCVRGVWLSLFPKKWDEMSVGGFSACHANAALPCTLTCCNRVGCVVAGCCAAAVDSSMPSCLSMPCHVCLLHLLLLLLQG